MANSDEKVSKFVQAITKYAEEQRQKIHQEVEDFKAERLRQAEQQVLTDAYQLIQKERVELQNNSSREMSRRELSARKELLGKRRDMTDKVFAEVKEKIDAFAATPAYAQMLRESLQEMMRQLPAQGTIYEIAARDEAHLPELSALCPEGSQVKVSPQMHLGGLRGVNMEAGVLADDSLDTKLDMQREWFARTSGLTME